jgi:uncharacterized membrane protein
MPYFFAPPFFQNKPPFPVALIALMQRQTLVAACLVGLIALSARCSQPETPMADAGPSVDPLTCSVSAPASCPNPPLHYPDIAPIIMERCVSCHAGILNGIPNAPWPLTQYEHVADWQDTIRANLLDCSMPPPEAGIPMTNDERLAILLWIRCGFPR